MDSDAVNSFSLGSDSWAPMEDAIVLEAAVSVVGVVTGLVSKLMDEEKRLAEP